MLVLSLLAFFLSTTASNDSYLLIFLVLGHHDLAILQLLIQILSVVLLNQLGLSLLGYLLLSWLKQTSLSLQLVAVLDQVLACFYFLQEWIRSVLEFSLLLLDLLLLLLLVLAQSLLPIDLVFDPPDLITLELIFVKLLVKLFSDLILCLVGVAQILTSFIYQVVVLLCFLTNFLLLVEVILRVLLYSLDLCLFLVYQIFHNIKIIGDFLFLLPDLR